MRTQPKTCRKRIYFAHLFVVENYVERMTVDYRSRNDQAFTNKIIIRRIFTSIYKHVTGWTRKSKWKFSASKNRFRLNNRIGREQYLINTAFLPVIDLFFPLPFCVYIKSPTRKNINDVNHVKIRLLFHIDTIFIDSRFSRFLYFSCLNTKLVLQ